jgi:hypothetical protein
VIRSKDGFWLAIPTPAAGKGTRGKALTPGEWERRRGLRLRFVYRRGGPSLLVADGRLNSRGLGVAPRSKTGRGQSTVPIFLLMAQVKLSKRLSIMEDAYPTQTELLDFILNYWISEKMPNSQKQKLNRQP